MRTLLTLPAEVQLMVMDCVDDKDLLTLSLTCRTIHDLLEPVIASVFGADRSFELSESGMVALLRLSGDPVAAHHLKTLIIIHSGQQQPVLHYEVLHVALEQLGTFRRLHSIGVRHAATNANRFEPDIELAHDRIRDFMRKVLLKLALKSGLPIKNVVFEIDIQPDIHTGGYRRRSWVNPSPVQNEFATEFAAIRDTMNTLDTMSSPGVTRTLRFVRKGVEDTRKSARMTYDPQHRSFYGFQLLADDWNVVRRWLAAPAMLRAVTLLDCEIDYLTFSNLMITAALESVSTKHTLLFRSSSTRLRWRDGDINRPRLRNDWVDVFDDLDERCPVLSHCLLGQLRYNQDRMCRGATWEANNHEDVGQLIYDLSWGNCSRSEFKKEKAPSTGRKPPKKVPKTKKIRFTHRKRKS